MQWFKSAMVVSSVVFVGAMSANGCSSNPAGGDAGGDVKVTPSDAKAPTDAKPPNDANSPTCPSTDPTCETCDVSGYTPTAQGTPVTAAAQCAPADITAFVTACLSATTGSSTACQAWQTSENTSAPKCLGCTFTETSAATWGALACTSTGCSLNVPGCLDVALGQVSQENANSNGSCGDFLSASYGCQDAACSTCTGTDETTCTNDAVAAECLQYANAFDNASVCAVLNGDTVPAKVNDCFPASQTGYTDAEFVTFTNVFCGTGP